MPVRCKRLSEYGRNYKWKTSKRSEHCRPPSPLHKNPSAGLRSDQLGITKEPNFISKRRVPYHKAQISKSFEWKGESNLEKNSNIPLVSEIPESIKLPMARHRVEENQEHLLTPDAPRLPRKTRAHSEDSRVKYIQETPVADVEKLPFHSAAEQKEADAASKAGMDKENGVIYNKNRSVPPFKTDAINRETEYRSQFKGSPPAKGPKLRRNYEEISKYEPENVSPEAKNKERECVKFGDGSPRQEQSEVAQKQATQRKAMRQRYLQRRPFPHQSYGKVKTEYTANYLSPLLYKYRDGAWVHSKRMNEEGSQNTLNSVWFAEVKELRGKAEVYRRRAQGTHFSRDHLNQLLSNNNKLWDVSSNSSVDLLSNNIKALDLAGVHDTHPFSSPQKLAQRDTPSGERKGPFEEDMRQDNTGKLGLSGAPTIPVSRRLAWGEEDSSAAKATPAAAAVSEGKDKNNHAEEEIERLELNGHEKEKEGNDAASLHSWEGGRLPTPKLKTFSAAQRTHHDLTTPTVGGAFLVCPDEQRSLERRKRAPLESQHSPPRLTARESSKRKFSKNEDERLMDTSPSAGLKTVDALPLREDPWPGTHTPGSGASPVQNSPSRTPSCRIQGMLRDPEFQHNDDDRLSQISARSAASSSLASQILEQAQRRKENFWGKK